jgi:3-phenylpropionate/cinnamic acid dioxygenase small subunit
MLAAVGEAIVDVEVARACERFLYQEAELLDDNRVREWLELLTEDIRYEIPVRMTRERSATSVFSEQAFHMLDDYGTLRTRVERLDTEYAWAEDPPSRTRRLVTNVRVSEADRPREHAVRSNVLIYRGRYEDLGDLVVGERHDVLRQTDAGLRLAARTVLLDQTTLANNLAIFL